MPTMKEVAARAGVSLGTVSNVIAELPSVTPDLRQRVLTAIQDLGYRPNHIARSLKTRRSQTLGMLVSDIVNPFFAEVIQGAEDAATRMGFALSIMNSRDSIEQERHAVDVLRARRIDGLLAVVALQRSDHEHFLTLQAAGTPIVCLDRIPEGIEVDCVSIDGCASARVGVEHLLALGHTRIAYIGGERSMYVAPERAEGYVQAMNGAALTPMVYEGDFRRESGFTLTREILAQPAPVTAIFCGNVQIALGVLQALRCLNLRVPDDISVATFDYFDWLDAFQPTLTSVIQPAYQIGFQGAQMLIRRLNGEAMTPFELRVLPTELRIGESTAAPRARARKSGA